MNKRCYIYILILLLGALNGAPTISAAGYKTLWRQFEEAKEQNRPRSALACLHQIMALGQQERNAPQLLKATLFQYQLKEELNPDSLYSNLRDLEQWAQQEEHAVTRSILYSVLANQYAVYLARHSCSIRKIVTVDTQESPEDHRS